jgi:enoyl-CoA hydratase
MMADVAPADIHLRREGRVGLVTLDRPKALNALTWPMVRAMTASLAAWREDPEIEAVVVEGAGERGLCAGGDVRWLYDIRQTAPHDALAFWREEYRLNAEIARYPKPYVAFMHGIVMGGGVGISAHGRHRIVCETTEIAMPETTIGLVPDVGGTLLLARAQGHLGIYLGLTGTRMSGSDAIQAGFADTYVSRARWPALRAALIGGVDPIDTIIDEAAEPVPVSPLAEARALIDRLFAGATLADIEAALLTSADPRATGARRDLAMRSPKALALTLEAIRRARALTSIEQALLQEYRLVARLYEDGEFIEGVRALIVDKDKAPKWRPARIDEVGPAMVEAFFAPRPDEPVWR